jgi:hypothetical protein
MRNRHSQKVITSLLAATVAGFMSLGIMPEIRCSTDRCVFAPGQKCYAGGKVHHGYKLVIGFDG